MRVLCATALALFSAACRGGEAAGADGGAQDAGLATDGGGATVDGGMTADAGGDGDSGVLVDGGSAADAGGGTDAGVPVDGGSAADAGGSADAGVRADDGGGTDAGVPVDGGHDWRIRLRLEAVGPLRVCGALAHANAPDGMLLGGAMDLCGDDIAALGATVVTNLEAIAASGQYAMLVLHQGTTTPPSWIAACGSDVYNVSAGSFAGPICLPWNGAYQQNLSGALGVIATAIRASATAPRALRGVYFTMPTMTNGAEFHFRVDRDTFPYPGPVALQQAYFDVMDIFQEAFEVPVVFEGGHCLWTGAEMDCDTPVALLEYSVTTHGAAMSGVSVWNGAERFAVAPSGDNVIAPVLARAQQLGVSMGLQTVGRFSQPCRFTLPGSAPGDRLWYGDITGGGRDTRCFDADGNDITESPPPDLVQRVCVDTMTWFRGIGGTWAENWSGEFAPGGVYTIDDACRAAVDALVE